MIALVVAVLAAACSRRDPITSCDQLLDGPWRSDHSAEQWMILEHKGGALEIYPLFPDGRPPNTPAELETAPRAIDLTRITGKLSGDVSRRYLRRGIDCIAKAPVHVVSCANDMLELVLADPPAPAGFEPCSFPRPDSSRRERWRRE
jgi:hypothetical protein